jgi:glycosyltransferase involved in cell wall biosynthesis|tara:strand:- start:283 stop:1077 length:795 start_codon:yes stop_codon:yes gene_type:complete
MISLIIPTYRNPKYLDLCLKSAIEQQWNDNEIIVAVDGFIEESQEVLDKYKDNIKVLDLGSNQGMQSALNLAVMNATNEKILIVNDDNVFCTKWDIVASKVPQGEVWTLNQIEPTGPGIFNFQVKDFGRTPEEFDYKGFIEHEMTTKQNHLTDNGGIFPFAMYKKDYMIVGGFDTLYKSPFICDWDFFLKLDLNGIVFKRTHEACLYHFGSTATKNGKEGEMFKSTEQPAAQLFMYKWGMSPQLFNNLSHNPKNGQTIKGIKYE